MLCSSGNLSWRGGDKMLVSGTGSWLPVLPPEKVAVCDIISGQVENGVRPSMESVFHLGIFRNRPDVNVVLHFQSEYATVVACMKNKPLDFNVTLEVPYHVGEVAVLPYFRPGFNDFYTNCAHILRSFSLLHKKGGTGRQKTSHTHDFLPPGLNCILMSFIV